MRRNHSVSRLIRIIDHYGLDRYDDIAEYRMMAESGMLSDDFAQVILADLEALVEHQIDHPVILHRSPTEDDLYAEGKPELELGELIETPLRFGINISKPTHTVIASMTGKGKTTCIRRIIQAIEEFRNG